MGRRRWLGGGGTFWGKKRARRRGKGVGVSDEVRGRERRGLGGEARWWELEMRWGGERRGLGGEARRWELEMRWGGREKRARRRG